MSAVRTAFLTSAFHAFTLGLALQACSAAPHRPKQVTHHTHFARNMGSREWGYNVYLPPGYDRDSTRYPVIYMLHGYGDDENRMVFMAATLDRAIAAGEAPKAIMVFPNGWKASFYCDFGSRAWAKDFNADSYIIKELIPHIDSAYRTVATREGRLLEGFSMGGWGALHFAFKYPDVFGRVCALSSPRGIKVDSADHPVALARRNAEVIKAGTRIRLVVGGGDRLLRDNVFFDSLFTVLGIPHEFEVLPDVKHRPRKIDAAAGLRNLRFLLR